MFSHKGYIRQGTSGACCIADSPTAWHRRCACDGKNLAFCKLLCDSDQACQGYVLSIVNPSFTNCQIATTSACPDGCRGPYNDGVVGPLVPALNCAKRGYTGCFVKTASK